jgi:hypothetical protein
MESEESKVEIAPEGELLYKSELFDVRVLAKRKVAGITRDRFLMTVEFQENDPTIEKIALIDVPEDVYNDVSVGEKVLARLYYHEKDNKWLSKPPVILG